MSNSMGQFIFFVLFIIALVLGIISYFPSCWRPVNSVEGFPDKSDYSAAPEQNTNSIRQAGIAVSQELAPIRRKAADVAKIQKDSSNDIEARRSLQRTRDLIAQEHQKDQDQQRINQQQARNQAQQILDQQEQETIYQQQAQDQIQRMKDQR